MKKESLKRDSFFVEKQDFTFYDGLYYIYRFTFDLNKRKVSLNVFFKN